MKLKIIILFLLIGQGLFGVPHVETLKFYTGYLKNQVTVGQSVSIALTHDFLLYTGFESYLASYEISYFSPSMIDYTLGLTYKYFGWEHVCLHLLDQSSDFTFPVRNRFYMVW